MKDIEPIVTSTGEVGVSQRSFNRIYYNGERLVESYDQLTDSYQSLSEQMDSSQEISRSVVRVVATKDVVRETVLDIDFFKQIEVLVPVSCDKNEWLMVVAKNKPGRDTNRSLLTMVSETEEYTDFNKTFPQRLRDVLGQGFNFSSEIAGFEESLLEIWGETFGWSLMEIYNLSHRLRRERFIKKEDKTVWFSAVKSGEDIIAAAMAERLRLPIKHGRYIDLVESTEWKTRKASEGRHLMTAALINLNCQILSDLSDEIGSNPFIFAECNFTTRSDRAAHGAGFVIPKRLTMGVFVPQILKQNVAVVDGREPKDGLRDFTFVCLPKDSTDNLYSRDRVDEVLRAVEGKTYEYSSNL
ncbi:hypothetical protein KKG52_03620 [Patescibacteria group bacterium]|nr:hypothetical protein [Patescibacteria group bacterium]